MRPFGGSSQYETIEEAYQQIAHNIHLFVYLKLVDETWKGGIRRRSVSEIRQVIRAIEHGRPVTHLTYHAHSHWHWDRCWADRRPGRPA
jgi:hypothetical protein